MIFKLVHALLLNDASDKLIIENYDRIINYLIQNFTVPVISGGVESMLNQIQQNIKETTYFHHIQEPIIVYNQEDAEYQIRSYQVVSVVGLMSTLDFNFEYENLLETIETRFPMCAIARFMRLLNKERLLKQNFKQEILIFNNLTNNSDNRILIAHWQVRFVMYLRSLLESSVYAEEEHANIKWNPIEFPQSTKYYKSLGLPKTMFNSDLFKMFEDTLHDRRLTIPEHMVMVILNQLGGGTRSWEKLRILRQSTEVMRSNRNNFPIRFFDHIYTKEFGRNHKVIKTTSHQELKDLIGEDRYNIVINKYKLDEASEQQISEYHEQIKKLEEDDLKDFLRELVSKIEDEINESDPPIPHVTVGSYKIPINYIMCPETKTPLICGHEVVNLLENPEIEPDLSKFELMDPLLARINRYTCCVCGQILKEIAGLREVDVFLAGSKIKKYTFITNMLRYLIKKSLTTKYFIDFWELRNDVIKEIYTPSKRECSVFKASMDYSEKKLIIVAKFMIAYFINLSERLRFIKFNVSEFAADMELDIPAKELIRDSNYIRKDINPQLFVQKLTEETLVIERIESHTLSKVDVSKFISSDNVENSGIEQGLVIDLRETYMSPNGWGTINQKFVKLAQNNELIKFLSSNYEYLNIFEFYYSVYPVEFYDIEHQTSEDLLLFLRKYQSYVTQISRCFAKFYTILYKFNALGYKSNINLTIQNNERIDGLERNIERFIIWTCIADLEKGGVGTHVLKKDTCIECGVNVKESPETSKESTKIEKLTTKKIWEFMIEAYKPPLTSSQLMLESTSDSTTKTSHVYEYNMLELQDLALRLNVHLIKIVNLFNFIFIEPNELINKKIDLKHLLENQNMLFEELCRRQNRVIEKHFAWNTNQKEFSQINNISLDWQVHIARMFVLYGFFKGFLIDTWDTGEKIIHDFTENPYVRSEELIYEFFIYKATKLTAPELQYLTEIIETQKEIIESKYGMFLVNMGSKDIEVKPVNVEVNVDGDVGGESGDAQDIVNNVDAQSDNYEIVSNDSDNIFDPRGNVDSGDESLDSDFFEPDDEDPDPDA